MSEKHELYLPFFRACAYEKMPGICQRWQNCSRKSESVEKFRRPGGVSTNKKRHTLYAWSVKTLCEKLVALFVSFDSLGSYQQRFLSSKGQAFGCGGSNKKHHEFFTGGETAAKDWWCRLLASIHWTRSLWPNATMDVKRFFAILSKSFFGQ